MVGLYFLSNKLKPELEIILIKNICLNHFMMFHIFLKMINKQKPEQRRLRLHATMKEVS